MGKFNYSIQEPFNFLGLDDQTYEKAKAVVFAAPYSSTTYWKAGTKDGPQALIEASRHIELYDLETKKDISKEGIFTMPFLAPSKNSPEDVTTQIKTAVSQILADGKFFLMLGGEHSVTLGAVQAFKEKFENLSVLQIDAHTDLRNEFEGTGHHHACVMRRIRELGVETVQAGIRSVSEEEMAYIKKEGMEKTIFYSPALPLKEIIANLKDNVYLTFDLDGLDPSIMPSTGTPEPGGLGWPEVLSLIREVAKQKKIVGADVVELDPVPGLSAPDFLAAKLAYKIINYSI